jgi:multidrug resistance efflux pump
MMRNLRPTLVGLSGLVMLVVTAVGATLLLHSRAHDQTISAAAGSPSQVSETAICVGHVDVEPGVASLYPVQAGRVAEVCVSEDQEVKVDAVLLRLEDRPARFLVKQAEDDLKAAEVQLANARKLPREHQLKIDGQNLAVEAARARLSAARHALERKRDLVKSQDANVVESEVAADLVREAEAGLKADEIKLEALKLFDPQNEISRAEIDVAAKQTRLDQARYALGECSLRAPCDGKVLRIFVAKGEVLGPQPKEPAIQFCPSGARIVRAEIEQEFAGRVRQGQTATIHDDATSGPAWRGKVTRISDWYSHRRSIIQEPLQFNDVRTVECIIQLDPGQSGLRIGQRVRVRLQ